MTLVEGAAQRLPKPAAIPLRSEDRPYRRLGVLVLLITFGFFGGWAAVAPLDSAVVAHGQVKVEARTKVIQHLEGGIVTEIDVKDGDLVAAGQLLVRLNDVEAKAQLRIVRLQYLAARALEARLKAERDGADAIAFPKELTDAASDPEVAEMIEGERQVFHARKKSRANENHILRQRIEQLKEQIAGLEGRLDSEKTRIDSYRTEVAEWEKLFKEKLADKLRLVQLQRELALLEGEYATDQAKVADLKLKIGETQSQIVLRAQSYLSEITTNLREAQSKIADQATRILALQDKLQRTLIRAPVRGVVVGLRVRTVGAVIEGGQPIMEIVPSSKDYIVVAKVLPANIESVHVGELADIRFSAFDLRNTHVVEGKVLTLSADVLEDPATRRSYYEAEIQVTPAGFKQMQADGLDLLPGMPAEAMIKTGQRTMLNYLLKPFLDMFARAFREK
jgi:epimerase transport system membrane fusion protein